MPNVQYSDNELNISTSGKKRAVVSRSQTAKQPQSKTVQKKGSSANKKQAAGFKATKQKSGAKSAIKKPAAKKPTQSKSPTTSKKPIQKANQKSPQSNRKIPVKSTAAKKVPAKNIDSKQIKSQNPSVRKSGRTKITGSASSVEIKHRTQKKETHAYKVKKQKERRKALLFRVVAFILFFTVFFSLFVLIFNLSLRHIIPFIHSDYTVSIGEEDTDEYYSYKSEAAVVGRNGAYNISMDSLKDLCTFTITGNSGERRYLSREAGNESVTFIINTDTVYINGEMAHIRTKTFEYGGNVYVPVSFFDEYVTGINVEVDNSKDTINISRTAKTTNQLDGNSKEKYEPIKFKLFIDQPTKGIPEESIDKDNSNND